ncbi:hypothetical protein [Sphingomonas sp. BE137]|uniref:hypothetical protein n=1 Tax=Sphingomonas sp. BE137 TaxID=2817844 RepID=UPI001AE720C3|nr:hypothetical protein [Sphingomonas sp. BE137]MDR6847178.1 hypothetical protein [Sphingomonas sp. BE137]
MAQVKLTIQRGKNTLKDIAVAAGTAETQSDTMSLNIDFTKISKGDALMMIEALEQKIFASPWPML